MNLGTWAAQNGKDMSGLRAKPEPTAMTVDFEPDLIDQISDHVLSGFRRSPNSGIEVAGVLFGVRNGDTLRLVACQPIFCEYRMGPVISLSNRDREALADFLSSYQTNPRFDGLGPAGWYISHRSGIRLLDRDLESFDEFFPHAGQITLVVSGDRPGSLPCALFERAENGGVDRHVPVLEWDMAQGLPLEQIRSQADAAPVRATYADHGSPEIGASQAAGGFLVPQYSSLPALAMFSPGALAHPAHEPAQLPPPEVAAAKRRARGSGWEWALAWITCLALFGFVGYSFYLATNPAPLNLRLLERDGQIQASWDTGLPAKLFGGTGSVEIRENGARREFALTREQFAAGSFLYVTDSQDVTMRLRISGLGRSSSDYARFVSTRPQVTRIRGASDLKEERDRLVRDNYKLRTEQQKNADTVRQLQERIEQLERQLKQLNKQDPE